MRKMFAAGYVLTDGNGHRCKVIEYIKNGKIHCQIDRVDVTPDYPYLGEGETSFLSAGEAWQYINGKVLT